MKTCTKCKVEKPLEAFYRNKDKPDGYLPFCIECYKLKKLEIKRNPLMQLEKQIRSSVILENKLLQRENKKLCFSCKEIFLIDDLYGGIICKKCSAERKKVHREKNKEKINEYQRNHYEKNKEITIEKKREYYKKNKEKIDNRNKEYYEKNKEKRNEYMREYREKKKLEKQTNT